MLMKPAIQHVVTHHDAGSNRWFNIEIQIDVRLHFSKELIGLFVGFVSGFASLPLSSTKL
jgi:hypothetical protein